MAKYIGLLSSDARGKLGGMVMSRARGATTLKAHAVPRLTPSPAQNLQRVRMAAAIGSWRQLTGSSQTTWAVYAATQIWTNSLGTTYSPTGLQLYTQASINAAYFNSDPPENINPATIQPPPVIGATLLSTGSSAVVQASGSSGPYTGWWLLWITGQIAQSRNYTKTLPRKFMGAFEGASNANITTAFRNNFGHLPIQFQYYSVRILPVEAASFISGTTTILNLQAAP